MYTICILYSHLHLILWILQKGPATEIVDNISTQSRYCDKKITKLTKITSDEIPLESSPKFGLDP